MSAHRYWRLHISKSGGAYGISIGELIFATTPSGPQAATGGTAWASASYGSNVASNAFDGVTSSDNYWRSSDVFYPTSFVGGVCLQYDMGAGNAIDVVEMRLYFDGTTAGSTTYPSAFILLYSDDGITWTVRRSWGGQVFSNGETKIFDATPPTGGQVLNRVVLPRDYRYNAAANVGVAPSVSRVVPAASLAFSTPWSGPYFIAGSTTVLGMPFARRVDLVDQKSGNLVRQVFTKKDGQFRFDHIGPGPWTVVGVDNSAEQNSVIYAHVQPARMT